MVMANSFLKSPPDCSVNARNVHWIRFGQVIFQSDFIAH